MPEPYPWLPLIIPLTSGSAEDTSDLATPPGLSYVENVEFGRKGEVRGRPGLVTHDAVGIRNYDNVAATIPVDGGTSFLPSAYTPRSMFRYKDAVGERAGLLCDGRVFTWEGDRFTDRLFATSARSDRLVEVQQFVSDNQTNQLACADTFSLGCADSRQALFLGTTPSQEYFVPGKNVRGNSDNVTVGGHTYHCTVGNTGADNNLRLFVRRDYDNVLTITTIKTDCTNPTTLGDAPCCSGFGDSLYVLYKKTAATDHLVLLRVNPVTSTVTTTTDFSVTPIGPPHTIKGLWVNAVAGVVYVAFTHEAQGAYVKVFNTSCVDQALDATLDGATPKLSAGPVVIGAFSATVAWVAYTRDATVGSAFRDLVIGKYQTAPRADVARTYLGATPAANMPALSWGITHQPLKLGQRVILGICAGQGVTANLGSTWYDIDVTDLALSTGASGVGLTAYPGYVAMGPTAGTKEPYGPQAAVITSNSAFLGSTGSYRFPTMDYTRFSATGASTPTLGLNQVTIQGAQATQAGEETIISGSVPHSIARGYSAELEFPFLGAPELTATANAAGSTLTAGSYTVQATWRWTDEAGIIHRSGPSLGVTVTTTGPLPSIQWTALTYQLTEREFGNVYLEIWVTDTNPTATSPKYLYQEAVAGPTTGTQAVQALISSPIPTGGETLYTSGGAVFANSTVSGDGGCATVGRRIWLSNGVKTFASKRYPSGQPNLAPAWNDEGVLEVVVPSTAGRVVALQAMDDKLAILCERGIYLTQGDGPDDTGVGPDFLYPVRVADLGLSGPRGSISTDKGIFFHSANTGLTAADNAYGGIWLLDRGLGLTQVSAPVINELLTSPCDLTYNPEREMLYAANTAAILVLDTRAKEWSVWPAPVNVTGFTAITSAAGVLWACGPGGALGTGPGAFTGTPGSDITSTTDPYAMTVRTNHIYANGSDGLGWANVRSIRVLGHSATHQLSVDITMDNNGPTFHKEFALLSGGPTPNWPSERYAPEWKIPRQKCSSMQVQLSAMPATAAWVALRLDVLPRVYAPVRIH